MKIGNIEFKNYQEYQAAYIKKWELIHTNTPVDLNWCKQDWETRIKHPELYY